MKKSRTVQRDERGPKEDMDIEAVKKHAAVSGRCRENFRWYYLDGDLYIEGTGALDYVADWSCFYDPPLWEYWKRNKPVIHPWKKLIPQIRHVVIGYGCTELGLGCFECHYKLESVELPESVRKIGVCAFAGCVAMKELAVPEGVTQIEDFAFHHVPHITYRGPAESESNWGAGARN